MGAVYFIVAIVLAGIVEEAISAATGNAKAENYDYHFAMGVGAVFGSR